MLHLAPPNYRPAPGAPAITTQLDQVLDRRTPLTLFPLRITEYMFVGNALAISRTFHVRESGDYVSPPQVARHRQPSGCRLHADPAPHHHLDV